MNFRIVAIPLLAAICAGTPVWAAGADAEEQRRGGRGGDNRGGGNRGDGNRGGDNRGGDNRGGDRTRALTVRPHACG